MKDFSYMMYLLVADSAYHNEDKKDRRVPGVSAESPHDGRWRPYVSPGINGVDLAAGYVLADIHYSALELAGMLDKATERVPTDRHGRRFNEMEKAVSAALREFAAAAKKLDMRQRELACYAPKVEDAMQTAESVCTGACHVDPVKEGYHPRPSCAEILSQAQVNDLCSEQLEQVERVEQREQVKAPGLEQDPQKRKEYDDALKLLEQVEKRLQEYRQKGLPDLRGAVLGNPQLRDPAVDVLFVFLP